MLVGTIETYLKLDELDFPSTISCNEVEEKLESAIHEIQFRYNHIQDRFIALKTITETLRDQILKEKVLWAKELQETIELEKRLRERREYASGDKFAITDEADYKKKYEMFKDFYFKNSNKNLERYVKTSNYQQTLSDVETKCNMELLKIQHSITILKPLKEMAAKWIKREQHICQPSESTETLGGISEEQSTTEEETLKPEGSISDDRWITEDEMLTDRIQNNENELS